MMGGTSVGVGQGVGPHNKKAPFFVRAPPPGPLRQGVVPLTGYRGMSHALFFRLRESSNPRPKGHIEVGSTLTTNWATSSVGSESAPHFNMSLWSWVRALTEAKEKGMGHAPIDCEWDHPSSEWARGWGPYKKKKGSFFVRAPPPGPLRRGVVPLKGYPPSSQGFLSPPWARTWDHELRYPFEVVPTTNWASSSVGSGNYLEWVSKLMVPGSSPRRRKKPL